MKFKTTPPPPVTEALLAQRDAGGRFGHQPQSWAAAADATGPPSPNHYVSSLSDRVAEATCRSPRRAGHTRSGPGPGHCRISLNRAQEPTPARGPWPGVTVTPPSGQTPPHPPTGRLQSRRERSDPTEWRENMSDEQMGGALLAVYNQYFFF